MKVLVVDDCDLMRIMILRDLKKMSAMECDQAANGQEAVRACQTNRYDLVLMDWNMPVMSGFEALRAIRASGNKVPIIMVTTEAEKGRVIKALKAGANNYVIKPFQAEALVSKIKLTLWKSHG